MTETGKTLLKVVKYPYGIIVRKSHDGKFLHQGELLPTVAFRKWIVGDYRWYMISVFGIAVAFCQTH